MSSKRLSMLDATFLHIETRETPTHVAGLMTFTLPEDAPADFVKGIVRAYRAQTPLCWPWNLKLATVPFARLAPAVEEASLIDLDYHVRHTALPEPGGDRELGELISHLHGQMLDRSRPLWTCHLIEGLAGRRFAIYIKIHHALTDGVNGIRLMTRCLAPSPEGEWHAPWHAGRPMIRQRKRPSAVTEDAIKPLDWPRVLAKAFRPVVTRDTSCEPVRLPFQAPRSALNSPVTSARRVATQQLDLQRIKALGKLAKASVNDIFLSVCSSALRQHLMNQNSLPDHSLVAGVPVSLREPGESGGNAVGFLWANLATTTADPLARLQAIRASMQASKSHLQALPKQARGVYTMLTMAPAIGVMLSGLATKIRPPMNLTISNVPGPEESLYLNGARLEAIYPVSIPFQGLGLNITCISYAGKLNMGLTGSRDSLPSLQKIAVLTLEALDDLEAAIKGSQE